MDPERVRQGLRQGQPRTVPGQPAAAAGHEAAKCNTNLPFPVLACWEPALPKDLNSICFIEVPFFPPDQCIKLSFYSDQLLPASSYTSLSAPPRPLSLAPHIPLSG